MKLSTFGFLTRRGVRNLGKHWAMTIACIASLSVCMTLNTFATLAEASRALLTAACVRAENEIAGAPTGGMDQSAALRSTAGHALLLDCTTWAARQVPFAAAGAPTFLPDARGFM